MTNAPKFSKPRPTTGPSYEDMLEAFIDAAASAGLEPVDEVTADGPICSTLEYFGADAYRVNGSRYAPDSITFARLVPADERVDFKITTPSGVVMVELSFPVTRLGLRLFGECAAVQP